MSGFSEKERLEVFLLSLDRMLVHRRVPHKLNSPIPILILTMEERGAVTVKCLVQEYDTMTLVRD